MCLVYLRNSKDATVAEAEWSSGGFRGGDEVRVGVRDVKEGDA